MSLGNKVIKGSITLLLTQFVIKSLGLFSTLVLARILTPSDFGIVAIVTMVVFLFDILSEVGTSQYIIQKSEVNKSDLNTAWSINLSLRIFIWLAFIISVPYITLYFEEEKIRYPLYAISIIIIFSGIYNPGMYLHAKALNFKPQFKQNLIEKLITITFTITTALVFENYWALVVGIIVSYCSKLVLSFVLHDFRPKLSFQNAKEQFNFSSWMLFRGFVGYGKAQIDNLLVSRYFGLVTLGGYNMMKELSAMPGRDIVNPATAPLLSSMSKVKDNPWELKNQIQISLIVMCAAIFPIATFIFQNARLIVSVLLGEQWIPYSSLLSIMTLLLFTHSFASVFQHVMTAMGRVKLLFFYDFTGVVVMVSVLIVSNFSSIDEFAVWRSLLSLISVVLIVIHVSINLKLDFHKIFILLSILTLCSTASYHGCGYLIENMAVKDKYLRLILCSSTFFLIYFVFLAPLFLLLRKYEEINYLIEKFSEVLNIKWLSKY